MPKHNCDDLKTHNHFWGLIFNEGQTMKALSFATLLLALSGCMSASTKPQLVRALSARVPMATSPCRCVSDSGTTIPLSTQIVDNGFGVWTLANGQVMVGGKPAGLTPNAQIALFYNGGVFYQNTANQWFNWYSAAWHPSRDPRSPVTQPTPSVDKTAMPPATQIVDSGLHLWTVVGGVVQVDGKAAGFTANVTLVLWYGGTIYQQNAAGGWWSWVNRAWASSSDPRATIPPTGNVSPVAPPVSATPGTWEENSLGGMTYVLLKPSGYDGTKSYPVMLFLHQLQNDAAIPSQIDPWFDANATFRANHPAFVIAPRCANSSASLNWGGVDTASQTCGDQAIAILKSVMSTYAKNVQTNRVYVTGDSMGGIGSWDMIIRFPDMFAATFILAGATYDHDLTSSAALLKNFPIWAIHGQNDTQVPLDWERNISPLLSNMKYEVWAGYGHDVWDDAYPQAKYMDWLFAQSKSGPVTPPPPTPPPATGQFSIKNGQFIDPKGAVFVPRGIDIQTQDMSQAQTILAQFRGLNFIRLPDGAMSAPSAFKAFVDTMSAAGVVVEIEHHPWPLINALSGSELQAESAWYASLATAYKSNPYVWFGSMNEPQGGDLSAQHVATYNAIRNAGSKAIVLFDSVGGGNPGFVGCQMTTSSYAKMTNTAWDLHFYGWVSNMSTDQNVVNAALQGSSGACSGIQATHNIPSGDGQMPVLIGEFGDSTDGSNRDANWQQVISAVLNSGTGYAAWTYGAIANADQLTNNGVVTDYGRLVQADLAKYAPAAKVQAKKLVPIKSQKAKVRK